MSQDVIESGKEQLSESRPDAAEWHRIWERFGSESTDIALFWSDCRIHEVEGLVRIRRAEDTGRLDLMALGAIEFAEPNTVQGIGHLLGIGPQVATQIVLHLHARGLVAVASDGRIEVLPPGYVALRSGREDTWHEERRTFHFLDAGLHFVRVHDRKGRVLSELRADQTGPDWTFPADTLLRCPQHLPEWKRERGFPVDVVEIVPPRVVRQASESSVTQADEDEQINSLIVDRPVHVHCALRVTLDQGIPIRADAFPSFFQAAGKPLFSLRGAASVQEAFPQLLSEPSNGSLQSSWNLVAREFGVEESEPVRLSPVAGDGRIAAGSSAEFIRAFPQFCMTLLAGVPVCGYEVGGGLWRVAPLRPEGRDEKGEQALRGLRLVKRLSTIVTDADDPGIADELKRTAVEWTSQGLGLRELSQLAWSMQAYAAGYAVAQLEDMSDAEV